MPNDAAPRDGFQAAAISVVAHVPERRRQRSGVPAQAGHGCCCCCCCCLHTLGSLIGAAIAPNLGPRSRMPAYLALTHYADEEDYLPSARGPSTHDRAAITAEAPAPGYDWQAVTAEGPAPSQPPRGAGDPDVTDGRSIALRASRRSAVKVFWLTLLVVVIVAAVMSLLGGTNGLLIGGVLIVLAMPALQLVAALVTALALMIDRPDTGYQYRQLAKITLGTIAGAMLGIQVMVLPWLPMALSSGAYIQIVWFVLPTILGVPAAAGLYRLTRR